MVAYLKKALRTLQSEFPYLKEVKDSFYLQSRRLLRTPHEDDFRALQLILPGADGCYVDIGANHGQSIESILLFKPDAQIVSFEPNPGLAKILEDRYKSRHNVRVIGKGLGDSAGSFPLFVPSYKGFVYDGLASFEKKAAASWIGGRTVFFFDPARLDISQVTCCVDTLDSQQLAPVFIKVDVQGYEYHVLQGGRETLRKYEPVLMIEQFHSDPRTAQLVRELGYEEYHFGAGAMRRGAPTCSPNSFLITPQRAMTMITFEKEAQFFAELHNASLRGTLP